MSVNIEIHQDNDCGDIFYIAVKTGDCEDCSDTICSEGCVIVQIERGYGDIQTICCGEFLDQDTTKISDSEHYL